MRSALPLVVSLLTACGASAPVLAPPSLGSPTSLAARTVEPAATPARPAPPLPTPAPLPPEPLPAVAAPTPHQLLLEPPYSALGHPPLATEMLTLARDEELFQWALGGSSDPSHPSNQAGYHPATRVVVEVELLSRAPKGSAKRLLRVARSAGYWPFRACFEAAQRTTPKTERTARVRLTLSAFGKVLGARSIGKPAEPEYARCVLTRARNLDFSPGFSRKLDFEISLKQWPGHAPVPPRAPDGTPPLRPSPDLRAAFEALSPRLSACYEEALERDAGLWGRIALRLQLDEDGSVQEATPVETRFPNPPMTECARQAVLGARIPSAEVNQLTFAFRVGQLPRPAAPPSPEGAPPPAGVLPSPPDPASPAGLPPAPVLPPEPVH